MGKEVIFSHEKLNREWKQGMCKEMSLPKSRKQPKATKKVFNTARESCICRGTSVLHQKNCSYVEISQNLTLKHTHEPQFLKTH